MKHHHDVSAGLERFDVTRLLVAAISLVFAVKKNPQPELSRHLHRRVGGKIIDDDTFVDACRRNFAIGLFEGLAGIVGGHDDDDFWRWHLHWLLIIFHRGSICQS